MLAVLAASPAAHAQSEDASFGFRTHFFRVVLAPLPAPAPYACDAPSTAAKIEISQDLEPSFVSPSLLSKVQKPAAVEKPPNQVKIRRGGQTKPGNDRHDLPANFPEVFHPLKQSSAAVDMALRATLFLCNYDGYIEFTGIDYDLSGRIGNVAACSQKNFADALDGQLSLKYERGNWESPDGRQFFRPKHHLQPSDPAKLLGVLHLSMRLKDLRTEWNGDGSQTPVDIIVSDTVLILAPGEAP